MLCGKIVAHMDGFHSGSTECCIKFTDGSLARLYHEQDCCEEVYLEDVCGNPSDFIEQPLTLFEQRDGTYDEGSMRYTFYELGCPKGCITLRWYGYADWASYSTAVDYIITDHNGKEYLGDSDENRCTGKL